ncbi:hypothetical protein OAA24_00405 [bacterium]|nr:hypothetical protein [bacterium]
MTEINNVYGHPIVYPNSENILPPLEKERVRVVEAATRADIELNRVKKIEERIEEINILRQQAVLRYTPNGEEILPAVTEGEFVDIEV